MKEQCEYTIVLDCKNLCYIGRVSTDLGQLPRTRMLVVSAQPIFFFLSHYIFLKEHTSTSYSTMHAHMCVCVCV